MSTGLIENRYSRDMLKQVASFQPGTVVWWVKGHLTDEPQDSQAYVVWLRELQPLKPSYLSDVLI